MHGQCKIGNEICNNKFKLKPLKDFDTIYNVYIISCSSKKLRKAQVNPDLEEDENKQQNIEVQQKDEQIQIKQQNVEIEGDADSIPDKRKCSSHTINPQINSQLQE